MNVLIPMNDVERETCEANLNLIDKVASKLATKLPHFVEQDDLRSVGFDGLLDAVRKFNPKRGVAFKTYANTRIYGSIIDWLRSIEGRGVRNARRLGRDIPKMVSLYDVVRADDGPEFDPQDRHHVETRSEDFFTLLDQQLVDLPCGFGSGKTLAWFARERWQKHRLLKDIAKDLDLTESRMCQIDAILANAIRERGLMSDPRFEIKEVDGEAVPALPEFRTPEQIVEDANLDGVHYRCALHGVARTSYGLGDVNYCIVDDCRERVLLVGNPVKKVTVETMKRTSQPAIFNGRSGRFRSPIPQQILDLLRERNRPVHLQEITTTLIERHGYTYSNVQVFVSKMARGGQLERPRVGTYALPGMVSQAEPSPVEIQETPVFQRKTISATPSTGWLPSADSLHLRFKIGDNEIEVDGSSDVVEAAVNRWIELQR